MMNSIKCITTVNDRNRFDGSLIYEDDSFEKKSGRTAYLETRKADDKKLWFIGKNKNSIKNEYKEARSCPICSGDNFNLVFNKEGFDHVKCKKCNFVFVSPVLNDHALMKYYESESKWTQVMLSNEEKKVNKIMYNLALSFLEKESVFNTRKLLDIGSGSGNFLETAKERSWDIRGVEFNKDMIDLSKEKGLDVDSYSLNELYKQNYKFDTITCWFVLEHIKNIREFMKKVEALLNKDGLLLIGVPQIDALVNRLYGKDSPTFAGYSHINFFNMDSLNSFMLSLDFKLVAQETQITQLNNIKRYFDMLGVSKNSGINNILNDLTPDYIHNNMLGSNLISVYRKI